MAGKIKAYEPRPLLEAPEALVEHGKPRFGTFDRAVPDLNLHSVHRPFRIPLPGFIGNLRLKEWQAYQFGNSEYFGVAVLYDTKVVSLAQILIYDKVKKRRYKYEKFLPAWAFRPAKTLYNADMEYRGKDLSLVFRNRLETGRLFVNGETRGFDSLPDVSLELIGKHDEASPQVVCLPFAENRALYSHKCLMPLNGTMRIGNETIQFDEKDGFMIIDDHKAYYPYEMKYDWITGVSSKKGKATGFNFTDNQVLNPELYNENCVWENGELHLMPPVKIVRPDGVRGPWEIRDQYGLVDMRFHPEMENNVLFNYGVIKSEYHGPFGSFSGMLKIGKRKIEVKDFFGMGEKKLIRG